MPRTESSEWDIVAIVGLVVVFSLPLTLLIPGFSVWDVVPKVRAVRCFVVAQHLTWPQLNAAIVSLLVVFFCLHLEVRKRKLDDMVGDVLSMSHLTDKTVGTQRARQSNVMQMCVELLDTSAEHYEHLVLLRDELHRRTGKHNPPTIAPSGSDI